LGDSRGQELFLVLSILAKEKDLHSNIFEVHLLGGAVGNNSKMVKNKLTVKIKFIIIIPDDDVVK
jgi:hypothetical protein